MWPFKLKNPTVPSRSGKLFTIGTKVRVISDDQIYINYIQAASRLRKIDQLRWVYKRFPNHAHTYIILDIFDHPTDDPFDTGTKVVVIQDLITKQVYLTNELGITFENEYKEGDDQDGNHYGREGSGEENQN